MEIMFRPAPPSMRVLVTETLLMVGVHNMGSAPAVTEHMMLSLESKVISYYDYLRGRIASSI